MSMVLKNNTAAMWAMNELNRNDKNLSKSLKKVASGMKTNGAVDDASGWQTVKILLLLIIMLL